MWGVGTGSHFIGYLPIRKCDHCNNAKHWELYATYMSQMFLGVTEYTYQGLSEVCPICKFGFGVEFPPLHSRLSRWFAGKKTRQKWKVAREMIADARQRLIVDLTRKYYSQLGYFQKRRYRKMLRQVELSDFAIALEHT